MLDGTPSHPDPGTLSTARGAVDRLLLELQETSQEAQRSLARMSALLGRGERSLREWLSPTPPSPGAVFAAEVGRARLGTLVLQPRAAQPASHAWLRPSPPPSTLHVRCLGRFQVSAGPRSLTTWRSGKARGLFQLLLLRRGRLVPKEVLLDTLWPEHDADAAANSLKVAVHELRQALSTLGLEGWRDLVRFSQGGYSLVGGSAVWVDVEEFEARWSAGRSLERQGRLEEAVAEYERAARLYTGDLLEEDPYEEWLLVRREGLLDTYQAILERLGAHYERCGDYESAIEAAQRLLARDPAREEAYRLLVVAHARLGRRSRALRWYQLYLRAADQGTPTPARAALYQRLRRGQEESPSSG